MCQDNNTNQNQCCIANILEVIVKLQNRSDKFDCSTDGCERPFLGPVPSQACYNTRPVNLYRCSDGETWTLPYTLNGTTGTSNVLRCEQVDGCCATCRILAPGTDPAIPFVATESYVTINLSCVGAIQCLPDTFISCS